MANIQFPNFTLVRDQSAFVTKDIPIALDGEINGDKIPDKVELIQQGNQIGFRLCVGTYKRVVPNAALRPNPLFGNVPELNYEKKVIWEVKGDTNTEYRVENFEVRDVNSDGDLDIRFSVRQKNASAEITGVFILMNQTVVDPELATLEPGGKQPQPKDKAVPTDGGEKKGPPSEQGEKIGKLSLVL